MLPLQLILKKYLGIMSEITDDKYLKSLVNTENNNQQYQLVTHSQTNRQNNSNDTNKQNNDHSDSETEFDKKNQIGGIIQSNPPISLREIYEQQKQAGSGVMSPSVKHILLSESKNNNHGTEKRQTEMKHSERKHEGSRIEGGKKAEKINIRQTFL
jgi:hypothetical protein